MGSPQTPTLQEFLASGVANPFATNWVPNKCQLRGMNPAYQNGPMRGQNWWHFSCWPVGESYFSPGQTLSKKQLEERARAGSNLFSFLKVEVEYSQNGLVPRCVTFDIGGGLDIFLPPSSQIIARVLVPDPESIPEELPPNFTEAEFASLIAIKSNCVHAPVGRTMGTYSQCYFVTPAVPAQATLVAPLHRAAKRVTVLSSESLTADLVFGFARPPLPDVLEAGDLDAETTRPNTTPPTSIPGTANVIQYTPAAPVPQLICVVEELEF